MGTACFWRVQTYERLARKELPPCQVQLEEGTELEAFNVQLFEARARDPKVPRGKPFAKLSTLHLALPEASKITRNPPPPSSICPLRRDNDLPVVKSMLTAC